MMKKSFLAAVAGAAALQFAATEAANTTAQFDVTISLTSACTIGAIAAVDFVYTSGGVLANSTGGTFNVSCTNTMPYAFGLFAGTAGVTPPGTGTLTVTDAAVNLQYVLTAPTSGTGSGANQAKTITGTMAAAQGGTCAAATCTNSGSANKTQTLIVNF